MLNIFLRPQGYISSGFLNTDAYRLNPHTGIDFVYGYKKPQGAMADGIVYKKIGDGNPDPMVYHNVYMLCDTKLGTFEISYVHCFDILADVGDHVLQGQPLYLEGNTGTEVFVNGVKVTKEQKASGRGAHSHIAVRPVERTKDKTLGHYLNDASGNKYKDENGFYYHIVIDDEKTKGCIDYSPYLYTPTKDLLIAQLNNVLGYLKHKLQ